MASNNDTTLTCCQCLKILKHHRYYDRLSCSLALIFISILLLSLAHNLGCSICVAVTEFYETDWFPRQHGRI